MKLFHISDLHIGKQLHRFDLIEDQKNILEEIVACAKKHRPDVILIAGDIYDKAAPSGEAYDLFDYFLNLLASVQPHIPVLIIAGNHDNASRLHFGASFLEKSDIHISVLPPRKEDEHLLHYTLQDEYGDVTFYLLPFTKPSLVRGLFTEEETPNYQNAIARVIEREQIDYAKRNVLLAHQFFVCGDSKPETCDSETTYISVGGIDCVDIACVKNFDYVALGHLHGAQKIGENYIRYSGTPLKYSVSEAMQNKGITMVTLGKKGEPVEIETIPLHAMADVKALRGNLQDILAMATPENKSDYVSVTITDENVYRPKEILEEYFEKILEVRVDNMRTRNRLEVVEYVEENQDVFSVLSDFYQEMNGQPMTEDEAKLMAEIIDGAKEDAR